MYGELFRNGSHAQCSHVEADGSCSIYYCVRDSDENTLLWVRQRPASATRNECDKTNSFTISQYPYAFSYSTHAQITHSHNTPPTTNIRQIEKTFPFSRPQFSHCVRIARFSEMDFGIGTGVRLFYILMEISLFLGLVRVFWRRPGPAGLRSIAYILNMYFVHSWPFMRRSFCDKSFLYSCFSVMVRSCLFFCTECRMLRPKGKER